MTPHGKDFSVKRIRLFRSLEDLKAYWEDRAGEEVKRDPEVQKEKNLAKLRLSKDALSSKPKH